ncbi:MAG: hypothetical protein AAB360_00815 [Patescibacteria group bacterium]
MKAVFQKSICILLVIGSLLIQVAPILSFPTKVRAQEDIANETTNLNVETVGPDGEIYGDVPPEVKAYEETNSIYDQMEKLYDFAEEANFRDDDPTRLSPSDLFGTSDARIILRQSDYLKVKALYCISESVGGYPDYENDLALLAKDSGRDEGKLTELKNSLAVADRVEFRRIMRGTLVKWGESYDIKAKLKDEANLRTLECITGLSGNALAELRASQKEKLDPIIDDAVEGLKIDIRIIKTLVYLVTPKEKGGAGHYRIRVHRIFQIKELSTESDAILGRNLKQQKDGTAADIGQAEREGADATIEDASGNAVADAYLEEITQEEDKVEANRSAHADGQAVDISEIDDIRCTVVGRRRVGQDKVENKPAQPVRLSWQTNDGYSASGGNNAYDLMELMRESAKESLRELANGLGGDITDYEGDLSRANLEDLTTLIGKSLFAEIINSPGAFLSGYDVGDTMEKLGSMYLADYLGLPREVFAGRGIESFDDISVLVGEASIEKKLNQPIGLLEPIMEPSPGNSLSDLEFWLRQIGRRKIALEMNLNLNDLVDYSGDKPISLLVGQKAIEKGIDLPPGSFNYHSASFNELKSHIGTIKVQVIQTDPAWVDRTLHIPLGSTKKLLDNKDSEEALAEFIALVGTTRIEDTVRGFKYLAAHSSAYNLPDDDWERAVNGDPDGLTQIGIFMAARAFAEDNDDYQRLAIQQWINDAVSGSDNGACVNNPYIKKNVEIAKAEPQLVLTESGQFKEITISEDSARKAGLAEGDLCQMFGQKAAAAYDIFERIGERYLYYAFVNAVANEERVKVDLMQDPAYHITNTEVLFYTTRVEKAQTLSKKIKKDWETLKKDERLKDDPELMSALDEIIAASADISSTQTNISGIRDKSRQLTAKSSRISARLRQKRAELSDLSDHINALVRDTRELYRTVMELIEGQPIPAASLLEANQIKTTDLSRRENGRNNSNVKVTTAPTLVAAFLKGRIKPAQFFKKLAISKVESELNLPKNSVTYYVQNWEIKGVEGNNIDAFYQAIGQAKIEEKLGLPEFYFQGPIYKDVKDYSQIACNAIQDGDNWQLAVDERSDKLYGELQNFYRESNKTIKVPGSGDNINIDNENQVCDLLLRAKSGTAVRHREAKQVWREIERAAISIFRREQNEKNKNTDSTMTDVARNVDYQKLADGIRGGNNDVMLRFGLAGSLEAAFNQLYWSANPGSRQRAEKIDRDLGITAAGKSRSTNTQALFTGETLLWRDGQDMLTETEKNSLAESGLTLTQTLSGTEEYARKIALSEDVLNRYLQVLNNEIDLNGFKNYKQHPVSYNSTNRYQKDRRTNDDAEKSCKITYTKKDGFEVAENSIQDDAYVYVDAQGKPYSFRNKEAAAAFIKGQGFEEQYYISLLAQYLYDLGQYIQSEYGPFSQEYRERFSSTARVQDALERFLQQADIDLLPFAEIIDKAEAKNHQFTPENQILFGNTSLSTLRKLFGQPLLADKPLQRYRHIVGSAEAKRILTATLLRNVGITINPEDFGPEDFLAILSGDYRPLTRLGATLIDKSMDLPQGSTRALFAIQSLDDITCVLSDIGAQRLGKLVGLKRLPLNGEIGAHYLSQLYHNMGQAKIEETLGLPYGSFRGQALSTYPGSPGLIENIGHLNFALAFEIPLEGVIEGSNETIASAALQVIGEIMGQAAVEKYRKASTTNLLKLIRDNLAYTTSRKINSLESLDRTIYYRVSELVKADDKNGKFWQGDLKKETEDFFARLRYLDGVFELDSLSADSRTFALFNGKIKPDAYAERVAAMMARRLTATSLANAFGIDEEDAKDAKAAYEIIRNWNNIFHCYDKDFNSYSGPMGLDDACAGWNQNWGKLYDGLSKIVDVDLDDRAGLSDGSMRAMINNPEIAPQILLANGAADLDEKWELDTPSAADITGAVIGALGGSGIADIKDGTFATAYTSALNWQAYKNFTPAERANLSNVRSFCAKNYADPDLNLLTAAEREQLESKSGDKVTLDIIRDRAIRRCSENYRLDGSIDPPTKQAGKNRYAGLQRYLSGRISAKISDATGGTIKMPAADLERLVFEGDMRFVEIAAVSYLMNITVNDTGGKEKAPNGYIISYDDIRLAIVGDRGAEESAALTQQYVAAQGVTVVPEEAQRPYGATCPDGSSDVQCIALTQDASQSLARNHGDLTKANTAAIRHDNGIDPNLTEEQMKEAIAARQIEWERTVAEKDCRRITATIDTTEAGQQNAASPEDVAACRQAMDGLKRLEGADLEGRGQARQYFRDTLMYRTLDIMLWKMDQNIYPGFAYDMIKGNWQTRIKAIGIYVLNGAERGELFGQKLPEWAKEAAEIGLAVDYLVNISGRRNGDRVLDQFITDRKVYNFFENKLRDYFQEQFNVGLPAGILGGVLIGTVTSDWGFNTGNENYKFTVGGKEQTFATLKNIIEESVKRTIFRWADKKLNIPAGTIYQAYNLYRDITKARFALNNFNAAGGVAGVGLTNAENLASLSTGSKVTYQGVEWTKQADGNFMATADGTDTIIDADTLGEAQATKQGDTLKQGINAAKAAFVTYVVTTVVNKLFGEAMAKFDQSLGLVPGTTGMIVNTAIGVGVGMAFGIMPDPWLIGAQLLYIVAMNLFSVYKTDVYCTADGFYPDKQAARRTQQLNSAVNPTGLGIWDGSNTDTHRDKSIGAAQARARQLIGDVLQMQFNPYFADVIPNQIMTGREEDVAYWNELANENLCRRMGPEWSADAAGVCTTSETHTPDERAGVWANPQTVGFTHIGF